MTVFASLLFIAIWSLLIAKLHIFPYTYLFTFLVAIIIFGELTSATSKETTNIIFAGATPIN